MTAAGLAAEQLDEHMARLLGFHERQILPDSNEEDVEIRERQIMRLQHEYRAVRELLRAGN